MVHPLLSPWRQRERGTTISVGIGGNECIDLSGSKCYDYIGEKNNMYCFICAF
jgi:hypothetical protein